MATATWKDRSDISFLTFFTTCLTRLLRQMFVRQVSNGLWVTKVTRGSYFGAAGPAHLSKYFPNGFFAGVLALRHIDIEIEWMRHAPLAAPLPTMSISPPELRHEGHLSTKSAAVQLKPSSGDGDNCRLGNSTAVVCPSWPCTQLRDIWIGTRPCLLLLRSRFAVFAMFGTHAHLTLDRALIFDKCMAFHASALRYEGGALQDFWSGTLVLPTMFLEASVWNCSSDLSSDPQVLHVHPSGGLCYRPKIGTPACAVDLLQDLEDGVSGCLELLLS